MITTTLLLDLLANLLAAGIYLSVARIVASRPVEPSGVPARQAFTLWWNVLGGFAVYAAIFDVATMAGYWDSPNVDLASKVALLVTAMHVALLVLMAALAALFYYLIYLYTGRSRAWRPIALAYGLFWAALVYWVEVQHPIGLKPGPITPQLAYEHSTVGTPAAQALGLLLLLPIIASAVAYFTLFFRTRDTTQRYRIAVVSTSIVVWFSFSLSTSLAGAGQSLVLVIASRLVSLAAAASVYLAYRPPAWVQRRWNVQPSR
jgi:hypothetical protein